MNSVAWRLRQADPRLIRTGCTGLCVRNGGRRVDIPLCTWGTLLSLSTTRCKKKNHIFLSSNSREEGLPS
ncbi:MAG: hypothetical protein ACK53Y_04560, partial [bacterium]